MSKTPVLLGMVMILEAVVLFAGFKFLGAGASHAPAVELKDEAHGGAKADAGHGGGGGGDAHGGGGAGHGAKGTDKRKLSELPVVDFKAPNVQNGRRYLYSVTIVVAVKGDFETKVKDKLKEREAMVKDRLRTIIAQMDPDKLGGGEPGLETLRRQVKTQLEIIIGDEMIEEVLVPQCIPFRSDF